MGLTEMVRRLIEAFPNNEEWIYFMALGEEAGEVQGAYVKWITNRKDKPKYKDDVLKEMAQLVGCVLLAAETIDIDTECVMAMTAKWLERKRIQITSVEC